MQLCALVLASNKHLSAKSSSMKRWQEEEWFIWYKPLPVTVAAQHAVSQAVAQHAAAASQPGT